MGYFLTFPSTTTSGSLNRQVAGVFAPDGERFRPLLEVVGLSAVDSFNKSLILIIY